MAQVGVGAYVKCGVYDNVQIPEKYFWLIASSLYLQFCSSCSLAYATLTDWTLHSLQGTVDIGGKF